VRFNIGALCDIAAVAGDEPSPIITIEKMEGGFSKALLMKKENGQEVIAKIPCRIAGPACLTTASEVGVLEYSMFRLLAHYLICSHQPISSKTYKHPRSTSSFVVLGQLESCRCRVHSHGEGPRGSTVSTMGRHGGN
jgi:hypothetical protein